MTRNQQPLHRMAGLRTVTAKFSSRVLNTNSICAPISCSASTSRVSGFSTKNMTPSGCPVYWNSRRICNTTTRCRTVKCTRTTSCAHDEQRRQSTEYLNETDLVVQLVDHVDSRVADRLKAGGAEANRLVQQHHPLLDLQFIHTFLRNAAFNRWRIVRRIFHVLFSK